MDDTVKPIRKDIVILEGKQTFLDTVADAYDKLTHGGDEPVALVFGFVSEAGVTNPGYLTIAKVKDRNLLYISRAIMAMHSDFPVWEREMANNEH